MRLTPSDTPGGSSPVRALAGWVTLTALLVTLAVLGSSSSDATTEADQLAKGSELYQRNCAVCHAHDGSGVAGVAPPITQFSAPRVDLSMRTGRMPLSDPMRGVEERTFTAGERRATMAYLREEMGLEGQLPDPPAGDAGAGQEIYTVNCAQCHGAAGSGGVAGDGVKVPHVVGLDETTIATATRTGPFAMPHFTSELISDEELGDIVAFLDEDVHQANSPLGLEEVGELQAIFFAALLTGSVVLVCVWAAGLRERRPAPPPGDEDGGQEG